MATHDPRWRFAANSSATISRCGSDLVVSACAVVMAALVLGAAIFAATWISLDV